MQENGAERVARYVREVYRRLDQDISPRLRDVALELDLADYLAVMGELAGRRVLDFGAGQGHKGLFFAHQGAQVLAIDAEAPQIERCQANLARCPQLAGSVEFRLGDEGLLPELEQGAFDLVFCSEVIEHFPADQARALCGRFLRLLRPGGLLFLTTPNGAIVEPQEQEGQGHYAHHHNFRLDELDALLAGQEPICRKLRSFPGDAHRNRRFYRLARMDTRLRRSRKLPAPLRAAYAVLSLPGVWAWNALVHPPLLARYRRYRLRKDGDADGSCIFYGVRKPG